MVKPLAAVDAEKGIISALFINPYATQECMELGLIPAAFTDEVCQALYVICLEMHRKGLRIDINTFWAYLVEINQTERFQELMDILVTEHGFFSPTTSFNVPTWVKLMQQREERREVYMFLSVLEPDGWEDLEARLAEAKARFAVGRKQESSGPQVFNADDLLQRDLPPVKWVIEGLLPEGLTLFVGKSKMGKAQPLDTPLLTPDGYRSMGSVRVGDAVLGRDGLPTQVTAVHPQGEQQVYCVTFADGTRTEATAEHLWTVQTSNDKTLGRQRILTTAELGEYVERPTRVYIPMASPVHFPERAIPVDPYVLGALLGDGGLTKNVVLTTADEAIAVRVASGLAKGDELRRRAQRITYSVVGGATLSSLRELGLMGLKSIDKHIPPAYKYNGISVRLELLRGLMDTDGYMQQESPLLTVSSLALALDVQELVETLGGTAKLRRKKTARHDAWVVTLKLPKELGCPFRLPRKAERWWATRPTIKRPPTRRVVSVVPTRRTPCQCITVANAEGLYLTEHCIVTHNSWLALGMLVACATGGKALGQIPMERGACLYLALEDNARRLQARCQSLIEAGKNYSGLHMALDWPRVDEGGLELLRTWLGEHPDARLVVIDTLKKIRPEGKRDQSVYDRDYESVEGLQQLAAEHHVAIVVIHHMRKLESDDPVDSISGSTGLPASADGLWVFNRNRRESDGILYVVHREGDETEIALAWDDVQKMWFHRGNADDYRGSKERKQIYDFIKGCPQPVGPKEVAESLDRNYHTTKNLMTKMVAEGSLTQVSRGLYKIDATSLTRGDKSDTSVVEGAETGEKVLQFPQRDAKNPSTTAKTTVGSDRSLSVVDSTTKDYGQDPKDYETVVDEILHVDAECEPSEGSKTTNDAFLVPGFEEDDDDDDLAGIEGEDPF